MAENAPKKDWFWYVWVSLWIGIVVLMVVVPHRAFPESVPLTWENWPGFLLLGALYSIPVAWVMAKIYPEVRWILFEKKIDWFDTFWFCLWFGITAFIVATPQSEYPYPLVSWDWMDRLLLWIILSTPSAWVMAKIYPTVRALLFQDGEPID